MAENVFNKTIAELQRWKPGESVSARKLNAPLDAIETLTRGVGLPHEKRYPPVGGGGSTGVRVTAPTGRTFKLQPAGADLYDLLSCVDPETDRPLLVHKPFILRRLRFDVATYAEATYAYANHRERLCRPLDVYQAPRREFIRMPYTDGDDILAVPSAVTPGQRTGMVVDEVIPDTEVRVSGGEGDALPARINIETSSNPLQYHNFDRAHPEILVYAGGRTLQAQLAIPEQGSGNDDDGVLSIRPDHGLEVGQRVDLKWFHELVDASVGRNWMKYVSSRHILFTSLTYQAEWSNAVTEEYHDILSQYPGQRFDHYSDVWQGDIQNYSLIIWFGGGTDHEHYRRFADMPFAGPILNGEWTGRVVLLGAPRFFGAARSVNELTPYTGMAILDNHDQSDNAENPTLEVHPLTRYMTEWYTGQTLAIYAPDANALSTLDTFPTLDGPQPWIAEKTVSYGEHAVSWVVAGNVSHLGGRPPWSTVNPGSRNWPYMLALSQSPVLGGGGG